MERIQDFAQAPTSNWQSLAQLAADHHLRPWLYKYYRQMPEGMVPREVLHAYKELIESQRFLQLKLLREFFRIQRVLEKELIPVIPFKGFRMGHGYYGNPELREFSDLDVLISRDFLRTVIRTLEGMGYVKEPGYNPRNLPLEKVIKKYPEYNLDLWENGQRIAHVELHWQIAAPPFNIDCYYEKMSPFVTQSKLQGKQYACFTPGGDLLMAAFHHGGKEEWTRLGHILDIGMILRKYPDADYAEAIRWAEQRHISRIILTGIQLAHQLCRIEIPDSIREKANAPEILAIAKNRIEKIQQSAEFTALLPLKYNTTLYHFNSRDTFLSRLHLVLKYTNHFLRRVRLKLLRIFSLK